MHPSLSNGTAPAAQKEKRMKRHSSGALMQNKRGIKTWQGLFQIPKQRVSVIQKLREHRDISLKKKKTKLESAASTSRDTRGVRGWGGHKMCPLWFKVRAVTFFVLRVQVEHPTHKKKKNHERGNKCGCQLQRWVILRWGGNHLKNETEVVSPAQHRKKYI